MKNQSELNIKELIEFRKNLHKSPELSGKEFETARKIENFISKYKPDKIINGIGGTGILFIFGNGKSPVFLLRAELDALPIQEINTFDYRSQNQGVSHKCGHDGHSTILSGVASLLANSEKFDYQVILLFQPAEETGEGAEKVLNDPKFKDIKPDFVFALHNLPGYQKNSILLRKETFASASSGIIIDLFGQTSHAAHPEQGRSPAKAMAEIILEMEQLPASSNTFDDFVLVTLIHAKLGEVAFGTTPGKAVIMATLRSYLNQDMDKLREYSQNIVLDKCKEHNINYKIRYIEEFPATVNDKYSTEMLQRAAEDLKLNQIQLEQPFRWSEDFGHFTKRFKGALFGIGAGEKHKSLHNEDYDFPDDIIDSGVNMFIKTMDIISHNWRKS